MSQASAASGRVYDPTFFDLQTQHSVQSANAAVPAILEVVQPNSMIDVGCGVGAWARAFQDNGVAKVAGVDGDYVDRDKLRIAQDDFRAVDLKTCTDIGQHDLVCCLEVAEHLPHDAADDFVGLLVRTAPVIIFSAAIPLQGGTYHINEQWQSYWIEKFEAAGYACVDCLRPRLWDDSRIGAIYRQNVFVFCKPELKDQFPVPENRLYDLNRIHPEFWQTVREEQGRMLKRPTSIRACLSLIGLSLRTIVRRLGARLTGK